MDLARGFQLPISWSFICPHVEVIRVTFREFHVLYVLLACITYSLWNFGVDSHPKKI